MITTQSKYMRRSVTAKHWKQNITAPKALLLVMAARSFFNVAYMADIIDLANCENPDSIFNTGIPLCDVKKSKMKGVMFMDKGVTFSGADIASTPAFIAAIKTKTTADRGGRVYPMFDLQNLEDNTGDPQTGNVGNLTTATFVTSDTVPVFRFGYDGSETRHKKMSAMNGASLDVMFIDDKFTFYGTRKDVGVIGGFSVLQAYADTSKFVVTDAVNQYAFRLTLSDVTQYREKSAYVVTNSGVLSAVGLINVEMRELSQAANVFHIQFIAEGGTDLEPTYGGALDGLTFTAVNLETGAAFTITSVADNPGDQSLIFTMNSAAWTALNPGDRVQIFPPSASALAGASIKPYEIFPIIVVREP